MKYTVALVQDRVDGSLKALHWHIKKRSKREKDGLYDRELEDIKDQVSLYGNYKVLFFLYTYDRGSMLSARIKCECAELRDLVKRHNDLLTYDDGNPVLNETYDLCCEVQRIHINRIGRLVRRLVRQERYGEERFKREIKDEIALQCYDVICKEEEARRAYEKMDRELNERYHRSQMNAYC